MATITKISDTKYRAQIRRAGHPTMAKTFEYDTGKEALQEAKKWASEQEREIDLGKRIGVHGRTGVTFSKCVLRLIEEKPDTARSTLCALRAMSVFFGDTMLDKLTEEQVVDYIESRDFSPASGAFHFSALGTLLKRAKISWKCQIPEIWKSTQERLSYEGLIGKSKWRKRRPTEGELKRLMEFDYRNDFPMADIIRFAISSGMRCAEITRIERSTFSDESRTVIIKDRKHPKKKKGNHKEVPLTDESIRLIKKQIGIHGVDEIFPYRARYIGDIFAETCKTLNIVDLHFHDLRHEATSRLFEMGYQPQEVQQFTGHEDLNMLMRYTHLNAKDVRRLEVKKTEPAQVVEPVGMDDETLKEFEQFLKMKKMMEMMKQQETAN